MYRACIFCYGDLGSNEIIEECPVGSRLAFDPGRGRLWVVCRRCERWNLTPYEDRWEAIENCERRFRATPLRYSTSNIGLARIPPGLDLVRIGAPLRPEMAAWRYGDQFGRRRRKHLILSSVALAAVPLVFYSAASVLAAVGVSAGTGFQLAFHSRILWRSRLKVAAITRPNGDLLRLSRHQVDNTIVRPGPEGRPWQLGVPTRHTVQSDERLWLEGQPALEALQRILPVVNRGGGSVRAVGEAVKQLETIPDPEEHLRLFAVAPPFSWYSGDKFELANQPAPARLALEMLLRESHEEQSLKGDLWLLEREWKAAEEIAAIADDLLLPAAVRARFPKSGDSAPS